MVGLKMYYQNSGLIIVDIQFEDLVNNLKSLINKIILSFKINFDFLLINVKNIYNMK